MNEKTLIKTLIAATGGLIDAALPGAGSAISIIGSDFADRQLSKMESNRVCYLLNVANKEIEKRLRSGSLIRDDGFFRHRSGIDPSPQEIVEGVLTKAKNEHIEKKNYHLGLFLGNLPFGGPNKSEANHLLNIFARLTYRQMIILFLFQRLESPDNKEAKEFWTDKEFNPVFDQHPSFSAEILELRSMGLLKGLRSTFSDYIEITYLGMIFSDNFRLSHLLEDDINQISIRILKPYGYYRTLL
jgi:hypothetical protein